MNDIERRARELVLLMHAHPDAVVWLVIGDDPAGWGVVSETLVEMGDDGFPDVAELLTKDDGAFVIALAKVIYALETRSATDEKIIRWFSTPTNQIEELIASHNQRVYRKRKRSGR